MLICWDFSYHNEDGNPVETKTSRQLFEEVLYPVQMNARIDDDNPESIDKLFVPEKHFTIPSGGFPDSNQPPLFTSGEYMEGTSVIFSLKPGFGFIKDESHNNVFFHYSTLTNFDFDDLDIGMPVKYLYEEDPERSKKDGAPRFRAVKVTVCS
jgi:cold shock CspA family protein